MTDLVPPEQLVMMTPTWRSTYGEHPVEIVDEKGRYWIAGSGRAAVFEPNGRFTLVRRDGTIDRGGPKTTFAPGHLVGAEHGLHSPSIRASRAEEVAEALFAEAPWVMDFDWPTIEVYCSAMARLRMFQEVAEAKARQLVEKEKLTPADAFFRIPAYIWSEMSKAETNVMRAADNLGLSPAGRAKIFKDTGIAQHFRQEGLQGLLAQGRALREADKVRG